MPDNLKNAGGQDRLRINVNEDYELRDWSGKFGVTPQRLKEAVQAVGDRADKVADFLKGDKPAGGSGSERGGKSPSR